MCHITLNKNAVVGDVSAMTPGGVRVGTPAMTSRGLKEQDFEHIADLLHEVVELCKTVQKSSGKLLKDFNKCGPPAPAAWMVECCWKSFWPAGAHAKLLLQTRASGTGCESSITCCTCGSTLLTCRSLCTCQVFLWPNSSQHEDDDASSATTHILCLCHRACVLRHAQAS